MVSVQTGTSFGGYEIVRSLGKGGMGWVFLAKQLSMNRLVALKVLSPAVVQRDPHAAERFIAEARTAGGLTHPHIVSIYDVSHAVHDGQELFFFSMDYIEGEHLAELLQRDGVPDTRLIIRIIRSVVDALMYAHDKHMVHRDIKPENIMISKTGLVSLADFGLSLNLDEDRDFDRGTDGKVKLAGSPKYMSPEQVQQLQIGTPSDIYSVGATLFFLLTGREPYIGNTAQDVMHKHVYAPVPDPNDVDTIIFPCEESLRHLCMRLMAKDPADRPDAASLHAEILEIKASIGISDTGTNRQPITAHKKKPATKAKPHTSRSRPDGTTNRRRKGAANTATKAKPATKAKRHKAPKSSPLTAASATLVACIVCAVVAIAVLIYRMDNTDSGTQSATTQLLASNQSAPPTQQTASRQPAGNSQPAPPAQQLALSDASQQATTADLSDTARQENQGSQAPSRGKSRSPVIDAIDNAQAIISTHTDNEYGAQADEINNLLKKMIHADKNGRATIAAALRELEQEQHIKKISSIAPSDYTDIEKIRRIGRSWLEVGIMFPDIRQHAWAYSLACFKYFVANDSRSDRGTIDLRIEKLELVLPQSMHNFSIDDFAY